MLQTILPESSATDTSLIDVVLNGDAATVTQLTAPLDETTPHTKLPLLVPETPTATSLIEVALNGDADTVVAQVTWLLVVCMAQTLPGYPPDCPTDTSMSLNCEVPSGLVLVDVVQVTWLLVLDMAHIPIPLSTTTDTSFIAVVLNGEELYATQAT